MNDYKSNAYGYINNLIPPSEIYHPNLNEIQLQRVERNNKFLEEINSSLINIEDSTNLSLIDASAIKIQKWFRGFLGRKKYTCVLYDSFLKDESVRKERIDQQVRDGEILVETYRMERDLEEIDDINKNKLRHLNANASVIQRLWREKRNITMKSHICCLCNDDYPDIFEYYSKTKTLCFCCEEHKVNGAPSEDFNVYQLTTNSENFNKKTQSLINSYVDNNDNLAEFNKTLLRCENYKNDRKELPEHNNDKICCNMTGEDTPLLLKVCENDTCQGLKHVGKINEIEDESVRVLRKIQWHDDEIDFKDKISISSNKFDENVLNNMSITNLQELVVKLEQEICDKNILLINELMLRDDLFLQHESLLVEAHDFEFL